jgi:hypothetical protein
VRKGQPCTLFHGYLGTRTLPLGHILVAEEKEVRNPGKKKGPTFRSGWHILLSKEECVEYLKRFKAKDDIVVCRVEVSGMRQKPRSKVTLAHTMCIRKEDWEAALYEQERGIHLR